MSRGERIKYIKGNEEILYDVEFLWGKLNCHHKNKSKHFTEYFATNTFEKRKVGLLNKGKEGKLRIDIAYEKEIDKAVGYCISTIKGNVGEVDSLFVEEEYRGEDIGDYFMKKSLEWMDKYKVEEKRLGVGVGNEGVFKFYSKYGFYPRTTILVQSKNS